MGRRASARASNPRRAASSRSQRRADSRLRWRPRVEPERAELAEAELHADRRRGIAVGLDDRRLAAVSARVVEASLYQRGVDAVTTVLWHRRGTAEQHDGTLRQVDQIAPCDGLGSTEVREVAARTNSHSRSEELCEEAGHVLWYAVRATHHVVLR